MQPSETIAWPLWRKILFRFCFIYLTLQIAPLTWLDSLPLITTVTQYYGQLTDWLVTWANTVFFHVRPVLVPENGSGDTSMGWARLWTYLSVGILGAIIWSILDRKRPNYTHLNYWLVLFARYFVIMISLSYGIIKVFGLQMVFPNLHQLATPLGDLLPMRFSWLFIGYSAPYQFFSGAMEIFAALLLLYRRTVSLGALVATGVFINVMMLNLCYDIPVKIFSMQMAFTCLFLLANESGRLIDFFILNRAAPASALYHFKYAKKWMRIARIVSKCVFIIIVLAIPFYNSYSRFGSNDTKQQQPVKNGIYAVTSYRINGKEEPSAVTDTLRWRNVIFEDGLGSVASADTIFRQRYKRGYFRYSLDSTKHVLGFKKFYDDPTYIMEFSFSRPDTNTIILAGLKGKDSLHVELKLLKHHFQLADRQFHWLSEQNR
ncbi:hypothetical protein ACXZ1K_15145 [Pedobacter sp. PWIIR3]